MATGQFMRMVGGSGFLVFMALVYAALAAFAFWRRMKRPEDLKGKMGEALTVSPVTTPAGASTLGD